MTESISPVSNEALFEGMMLGLARYGEVGKMDSTLLKEALESHGASFSLANKHRLALGASRHRDRADAVLACWGPLADRYDQFVESYVRDRKADGKTVYERDGLSRVGFVAVFDRITQVAAGAITTEEFGADIGRRIRNQQQLERGMAENKWEGSGREKRGKAIPDAPVPADFFDKLYTEMQTWRR